MAHSNRDRTLALAGVFQATRLVQQSATTGQCDEAALETSINSIFNTHPKDTEAVYGNALCVTLGLQLLVHELDAATRDRNIELMRYVLSVLYLERKLSRQPALLQRVADGIERARGQTLHFPPTHVNVLANLADTYTSTVSTLNPRIMVHGNPGFLANPDVANTVRAGLLAAIRSAVLWSQCGGNRWTLLFGRNKLITEARQMLQQNLG